jgi:hypothetical protein
MAPLAISWTYFIPLFVLGVLVVLFGIVALLSRIRGGKYIRPVFMWLSRVPLVGRWLQKMSRAALERQNPELASAIRKLERLGATRDPRRAHAAISQLTPAERRAWMEAAGEQEAMPSPVNRAQRRRAAKTTKRRG